MGNCILTNHNKSFPGIDTNNLIYEWSSGSDSYKKSSYTATEDCWMVVHTGNDGTIKINGLSVIDEDYKYNDVILPPIKKSQCIDIASAYQYWVYGVKY